MSNTYYDHEYTCDENECMSGCMPKCKGHTMRINKHRPTDTVTLDLDIQAASSQMICMTEAQFNILIKVMDQVIAHPL